MNYKNITRGDAAVALITVLAVLLLAGLIVGGAWESNKYGQRTSLGNRASQARAVLAALFGAKKGRK